MELLKEENPLYILFNTYNARLNSFEYLFKSYKSLF